MSDKLTTEAFASKIKSKYPQYENVEDSVLVESILEKYPQYSEQVDFKKKEESLPESTDTSAPLDSEAPSTEEQEVEVSGLTKEQELAEAKKVAEKDASKSLWRQFSDWTVDFASTVVGGVSEAIGLETGVQASETLLKDNAERREKVKKAKQVVENDILANPESNIEQYDFLTEEINKLEEEYRNKPYSPSMDEKLKELNAQKDVMAPGVEKVKSANWFKVNVLDATEETAIYQPTGSIEDSETGEDLGVSIVMIGS